MEQNNNVKPKGTVILTELDNDNKVLRKVEQNNLVVTLGRTNLTKLLAGDAAGKAVTQISVGTSNTAAALTDTNITNEVSKAITGITYPANNVVHFETTLLNADANGLTLREAGLKLSDNTLFARIVYADFVKTSANKLKLEWLIEFN